MSDQNSKNDECVEYAGVTRTGYHQHTIAVEWSQRPKDVHNDLVAIEVIALALGANRRVTKLMCICGDVKELQL